MWSAIFSEYQDEGENSHVIYVRGREDFNVVEEHVKTWHLPSSLSSLPSADVAIAAVMRLVVSTRRRWDEMRDILRRVARGITVVREKAAMGRHVPCHSLPVCLDETFHLARSDYFLNTDLSEGMCMY